MPVFIVKDSITKMRVDAIVNPTNQKMVGQLGIDVASFKGIGACFIKAWCKVFPLKPGKSRITKAYKLPAKYVIHTCTAASQENRAEVCEKIKSYCISALTIAKARGCRTVAMPLFALEDKRFPKDKVLKFALEIIGEFLLTHDMTVFLCVDATTYKLNPTRLTDIQAYMEELRVIEEKRQPEEDSPFLFCMLSDGNSWQKGDAASFPDTSCIENTNAAVEEKNEHPMVLPEEDLNKKIKYTAGTYPGTVRASMQHATPRDTGRKSFKAKEKKAVFHESVSSISEMHSLKEYMKEMDKPFALKLFDLIDASGMSEVECYKKANVSKKTFSKMKCNMNTYKPSKQTAIAFAIVLKLSEEETQELLSSAGMILSKSFVFDKIILYFLERKLYDIYAINEVLFSFDQPLLGSL